VNYRLLIDYEVIEFLDSLPRRERFLLRNGFVAIQSNPRAHSDYTEPDESGRQIDIHICGKFAVKYWEDHADRHIKILEVHPADQTHR
jgi:mRNA-degrading endonuclease RelE of RelBE toxin-antitoxin system